MRIRIHWPGGEVFGELNDSPTAQKIAEVLPAGGSANTWGEEVYFGLPVEAELEPDARQEVDPGTICFWVQGSSLALPFGPTPISTGDRPRLAAACNVLGRIEGDPKALGSVNDGDPIKVEEAPG